MFTDVRPGAKALLALEALQSRPGLTASQLGARLGVSERAARRYVDVLREAGVPVESVRGPHGGYRLGRGLRLPPLVFTATEALGLVMAVLDGSHAAADPDDPVGAALGKLIEALPTTVGRQASLVRAHAASAPDRGAARPDPATSSALVEAVASSRRVALTYATERGEWREEVDPWAVIVRHARWYLLCHSHRADAVRTYRVDRVSDVAETGVGFEPPADLDAVAALERHLALGWAHTIEVEFAAPLEAVQPWVGAAMGHLTAVDGDRCRLVGSTNNAESYAAEWLASVPFGFTVLGGDELRNAVATLADRYRAAVGAR